MNWWRIFNLEKEAALSEYEDSERRIQERSSNGSGADDVGMNGGGGGGGGGSFHSDRFEQSSEGQEVWSSNPMEYSGGGGGGIVVGGGSGGGDGVQLSSGIQTSSTDTDDEIVSLIGPTGLAILCACVTAGIFICLGCILWIKTRRRRQKKLLRELTFDACEEGTITKSAPSSRCPSPRGGKRLSCPEAFSSDTRTSPKSGTVLVKSWTCDSFLDPSLPPECVQPKLGTDNSTNSSYQGMSEDPPDYSGPPTSVSARGRIWFSTFYDRLTEQLNVNLIKVRNLPKRESTNEEPDPFVKMFLLPDEKTCQVSTAKKKTLSPVYNELHRFQVPAYEVKDRVLRFSVYDVDKRRVRRSLGHIVINLNSLDLERGEVMCSELERSVQTNTSLGDIQLSLAYIPAKEKVKIGIHKARSLHLNQEHDGKGAYVRIQLHYGHKCHRVKRTVTRPIQEDCPFDESLSFTIQGRQLESCSLVLSVMITHPGEFGTLDAEYGRLVIGPFMYARGEELLHWQQMVSRPKHITTRWHSLVHPAAH